MQTDLNRRKFLQTAGLYLAATSATCIGCSNAFSNSHVRGCALSASDTGGLGKLIGRHPNIHTNVDFTFFRGELLEATGLSPSFAFMQERNGYNAFALSEDVVYQKSYDGAVLFGVNLLDHLSTWPTLHPSVNQAALRAIMAHEWAHLEQFRLEVEAPTVKPTELMADFVAGWFVAREEKSKKKYLRDVSEYYDSEESKQNADRDTSAGVMPVITNMGDHAFNSPGHHGTPRERLGAYTEGVKFLRSNPDSTFRDAMIKGHISYLPR